MNTSQQTLPETSVNIPNIASKSRLAIELSKLKKFENPSADDEQYAMDSEIGAEILWDAAFKGHIEGKIIADLGCGTGILGIGALLLDAEIVHFVENDIKAIEVLKENLAKYGFDKKIGKTIFLHNCDVNQFSQKVEVVIQNPPFGTKQKHADRAFLVKAFEIADIIFTFHKATSKEFVSKISADNNFAVEEYYEFDFPIKMEQLFHRKNIHRIKVGCWRLVRVNLNKYDRDKPEAAA